MAVKLVVGLGNPGERYEKTRHNVGFRVLDLIAERHGVEWTMQSKWESRLTRWGSVTLMQPQTFMNESGRAAGSLARFFRWKPEEILVVYDDIALPLETLRFRMNGGDGGHNGIASMIAHLGTKDFPRLKVGIGGVPGEKLVGHVLGTFRKEEAELVQNTLARAADAVQLAVSGGVEHAANEFNVRKKKEPKTKTENEPEVRGTDRPEHPGQ